ncbi:MAG: L-rhamnose isomerase [Planctomycetota bacterium]|jgi:L-rhamnose isomerase
MSNNTETAYNIAKEEYAAFGSDTEKAIETVLATQVSMHCWQADDLGGYEVTGGTLDGGGIQVTGNYPGKARNLAEMRTDLEKAFSLIPGKQRLSLHAIYGEFEGKVVDRNEIEFKHFKGWSDWANDKEIKLDFNASLFSHPKAEDGFTLSSKDKGVRDFWIEHAKRARQISAEFGKAQNSPCVHNLWIPDGYKDTPVDTLGHRKILVNSLDEIFTEKFDTKTEMKDAVECKLFGIGSESYVVGSHEFYLGYAVKNNKMACLDTGHFHPTETIADKISSVLLFTDEVLLHLSRGVRWDSDHATTLSDDLVAILREAVLGDLLSKINFALDFFDGSINRTIAYVVGMRSVQKALLRALLLPKEKLIKAEESGNFGVRLALLEEEKVMPFGAIWNKLCEKAGVPVGPAWIDEADNYQKKIAAERS